MRSTLLVLAVASTVTVGVPAQAETAWFAPYVSSSIDNGYGPGPAPRGTAAADFTGDGRPDLVSINDSGNADVLLAPNRGDGTFGPATTIAGTTSAQGLDVGDLNGDGRADVVAMSTTEAFVLFGNGDGGFTAGGTYPLTLGGQVEPRVMDIDSDGDLDIVAPTFTAIQTLRNNGTGTFSAGPSSQVTGASALSAIDVARLNGDAHADLFAVDGYSGTTYALRGSTTGTFTVSGQLYGSGFVPEDVTAIDLDNDGFDDVATVGSFSFTVATGLTDGTGRFRSSIPTTTQYGGSGPTSAAAADLDRGGREDLVVSSLASMAPRLVVLAGNGTTSLRKVGEFAVAALPQNPVLADYTGDARKDIVTVGPGAISLLRNTTP